MKYLLTGLIALCMASLSLPAQAVLQVTGQVTHPLGESVVLMYNSSPLDYTQRVAVEAPLDAEGQFALDFPLEAARELILAHGREMTRLYAGPGEVLRVTLDAAEFDETIQYEGEGPGAAASNFLAQWFLTYEDEAVQRDGYMQIKELDPSAYQDWRTGLYGAQQAFLAEMTPKYGLSEAFVNHISRTIGYQWAHDLMQYPPYHRYMNQLEAPVTLPDEYYSFLEEVPLQQPGAMAVTVYPDFLQYFLAHITPVPDGGDEATLLDQYAFASTLLDDEALALVQALILKSIMEDGDVQSIESQYEAYVAQALVPAYVETLATYYAQAMRMAPGQPAPDFKAVDPEGQAVSLSDLQGKVVYMDFWASWCGPCRREMPASRELQERFAGEDELVFLYVSIDDSESAWREAMGQEKLGGVHLFSQGWQSEAPVAYGVEGIPAYFLIHRDGTIANAHAPRPSSGEVLDAEIRAALAHEQQD